MQHSEEADLRAQMLGVSGDAAQRLRGGSEQNIVNRSLVLKRDDGDRLWHCEHHVEVGHLEQFRLAVRQPLGSGKALTLRAASIAAAVRHTLIAAVVAALTWPPRAAVRQRSIAHMARRRVGDSDAPCWSRNA